MCLDEWFSWCLYHGRDMLAAATMLLLLPLLLLCLEVAERCCCVRLKCEFMNKLT
jgi:hypothetical protein